MVVWGEGEGRGVGSGHVHMVVWGGGEKGEEGGEREVDMYIW